MLKVSTFIPLGFGPVRKNPSTQVGPRGLVCYHNSQDRKNCAAEAQGGVRDLGFRVLRVGVYGLRVYGGQGLWWPWGALHLSPQIPNSKHAKT